MEGRINLRKRIFQNLGDLHYTAEVEKIFCEEQEKHRRTYKKFWAKLNKDNALIKDLLFKCHLHSKLASGTYKSLIYAFAKSTNKVTEVKELKEYSSALMGKYECGYDCFDNIIKQKEQALINHILDDIILPDIQNNKRVQVFMRRSMTLLILASKMKYDPRTEAAIDMLIDEYQEGRAVM